MRTISLFAVVALACSSGGGCKSHETPRQERQALQTQENTDISDYEDRIRKVVKDPTRADQLITIVSEMQKLVHDTDATVRAERAKAAALNANYASTRDDYQALFREEDANHQEFFTKAISLRTQMAALLTDDEWNQLRHARIKAFDAVMRELQE